MLALLGFQDLTSELSSLDEDMQKLKLKLNGLHLMMRCLILRMKKDTSLRMLEEKKGRLNGFRFEKLF